MSAPDVFIVFGIACAAFGWLLRSAIPFFSEERRKERLKLRSLRARQWFAVKEAALLITGADPTIPESSPGMAGFNTTFHRLNRDCIDGEIEMVRSREMQGKSPLYEIHRRSLKQWMKQNGEHVPPFLN